MKLSETVKQRKKIYNMMHGKKEQDDKEDDLEDQVAEAEEQKAKKKEPSLEENQGYQKVM